MGGRLPGQGDPAAAAARAGPCRGLLGLLRLCAGEDLHGIKITDPQGGEGGAPLQLAIPRLEKGRAWEWEYEIGEGAPLLPARMDARGKRGGVSLVSGAENEREKAGGLQAHARGSWACSGKKGERRALKKIES